MTKENTRKITQHVDVPLNTANLAIEANLMTVGNVINQTRNDLLHSFNPNNFIVDQSFVTNVEKIALDTVTRERDFRNQKQLLIDENTRLVTRLAILTGKGAPTIPPAAPGRSPAEDTEWATIPNRQAEITSLIAKLDRLLLNRPARQTQYQDMAVKVKEFNLTTNIPNMTTDTLTIVTDLMVA